MRVPSTGALDELRIVAEGYITKSVDSSPAKLSTDGLVVALEPSLELLGKVGAISGGAVGGAEIRAVPIRRLSQQAIGRRMNPFELYTVTAAHSGPDGVFRLVDLRASFVYEVTVSRQGFAPRRLQLANLEEVVEKGLGVVLAPGIAAAGKVLDGNGQPVPGASIVLEQTSDPTAVIAPVQEESLRFISNTGADGGFELAHLPWGTFELDVRASGFAPRVVPGIEIAVGSASAELGTVQLDPALTIHGRVSSGDEGVAGVHV